MSSTRHAAPGEPLRQERYASSPEFEKGLKANLVAKRCEVLADQKARGLVWFLQYLSHQDGGLAKVAQDILSQFGDRIGSASMGKFGCRPGQVYTRAQVITVRSELCLEQEFLMQGENSSEELLEKTTYYGMTIEPDAKALFDQAQQRPASYSAQAFKDACMDNSSTAIEFALTEFCLDPAIGFNQLRQDWFHSLPECLGDYMRQWISAKTAGVVMTTIGRQVHETLDYALDGRCMVLIDGPARTGKTFAAKAWCDAHPGQARYVQVPCGNDKKTFYRTLARALGLPVNLKAKSQEFQERVEETLQTGGLMLVLDEAHYLWPSTNMREAMPDRVQWLMTALVNYGVPVALITTPQFFRSQKAIEKLTCWTSEQFTGRIGHYQKLPDTLSRDDLKAVARSFLPNGDAKSLDLLVTYAEASAKYLAGIEAVGRRAIYLAGKAGRAAPNSADVKLAIKGSVIPSDSALASAMSAGVKPTRQGRRAVGPALVPMPGQEPCNAPVERLQGECTALGRRGQAVDLEGENIAAPVERAGRRRRGDRRGENDLAVLEIGSTAAMAEA